ncbi:MAG: restriction endonuclease subunit S [Candidatus Omnitrophota bacterium]|nr:restriction endonuclease subunit S [Candidatus Omnitrophota bacterium]
MADQTSTIPKGWKMTTLGEVISSGLISNHNNKRYPLAGNERARRQGMFPYYGAASAIDFIDEYKYDGFYLLVAEDGTVYDGKSPMLQLVNGKFWVSNHSHVLQGKDEIITKFLSYILKNVSISPYITGAVQPKLTKENLYSISFLFPENETEQRAIAEVLSSVDDKIELLREQNRILEETAQVIFKEWFVNFNFPGATGKMVDSELGGIPDKWRMGKLGEEFNITIGRTPPREEREWFSSIPIGKKWISIKDIGNSEMYISNTSEYLTDEAVEKFNIPIIPENTTIMSFKMTVGKLAITTEKMLSNEAIAHLKIKENSNLSTEFIYSFLKGLDFNSLGSTSSIVTAINSTMIKDIDIFIPEKQIMQKFNKVIQPIFAKLKNNNGQIQTLSALRDALLPKLMEGEVRVKGFNN